MPDRRDRLRLVLGILMTGLVSITPIEAHHSFAPYETTVQIKLTGVVTSYKWANPHVYFEIDVGSSRVDLQACKLEYSIVSPK